MLDQTFEYKRLWTELYETEGLEAVRKAVANSSLDYRAIGEALIIEFEEKERYTATHELAVRALDAQKLGDSFVDTINLEYDNPKKQDFSKL